MDSDIDFSINGTSLFQYEIALLEDIVAIVLGGMQILHDYLQFKKEKGEVPLSDVNNMEQIIVKFLQSLALIDSYKLFRDENQLLTDKNIDIFTSITNNNYLIRLEKFLNDLQSLQSQQMT